MTIKVILKFILGLLLSGGIFILSLYITDLVNDRLPLYMGFGLILILGYIILRKNIKPLTIGYWVGLIPIAVIIIGFLMVSSLH